MFEEITLSKLQWHVLFLYPSIMECELWTKVTWKYLIMNKKGNL